MDAKVRGSDLLANGASIRPTAHRLLVASCISACLLTALTLILDRLADIQAWVRGFDTSVPQYIIVRLKSSGDDRDRNVRFSIPTGDSQITENRESATEPARQRETSNIEAPATKIEMNVANQWQSIVDDVIQSNIDSQYRREVARASKWRRSGSVMFESTSSFVAKEQAPILADFRFKPEVHVAGLGVTIGSCFVGIPIAGVPVEQRTVAIRLFVCAGNSG